MTPEILIEPIVRQHPLLANHLHYSRMRQRNTTALRYPVTLDFDALAFGIIHWLERGFGLDPHAADVDFIAGRKNICSLFAFAWDIPQAHGCAQSVAVVARR